jgi:hypothetical protein
MKMIPPVFALGGRLRFELSLFILSLLMVVEAECKRTEYLGELKLVRLLAQCSMVNKALKSATQRKKNSSKAAG